MRAQAARPVMNPKAVEKNSRKPSNRRTLMARISLAVAVLLGGFTWVSLDVWTAPAGLIWHAFHGSTVSFEGRKIPVPRDMWVRKTSDMAVIMIREAPKYPLLHSPAGTIVFERSPGRATDMSKDYATIAHANESPAQKGYQVQVLRFPAPNGPAFCWQTTHPDRSDLYISPVTSIGRDCPPPTSAARFTNRHSMK